MRVLVTGCDGYIGPAVVRKLVAAGHHVAGLDAGWFRGSEIAGGAGGGRVEIPVLRIDVRDVRREHVEGFDAIVHLAALSNDPLGEIDADLTMAINGAATLSLAELARDAGVGRFLFSSSCSMYGKTSEAAVDESATPAPRTAYAKSKVMAEDGLRRLAQPGFSPVFLRNATAYGASISPRFDLVVPNLVAAALTTGRITLRSDGTAWRPLVHIQDIAGAFAAALEAPREAIHNVAFNVGCDAENYRVRDIARLVHEALPDAPVEIAGSASADDRSYRVSFAKIGRGLPAFRPRWDLRRGIAETVEAMRAAGTMDAGVLGPRGSRLGQLRALLDEGRLGADLRWARRATAANEGGRGRFALQQ